MAKDVNLSIYGSAIANDANVQIAEGKNAMLRFRPYVDAYAKANEKVRAEMIDNAEYALKAARARVVAHLTKEGAPNAEKRVALINASRTNEFKRLMEFGAFNCYGTVLNYFSNAVMNFDDVVTVAKFVMRKPRNGKKGPVVLYPLNRAAPAKAQCYAAIKVRKVKRRGSGETRTRVATKALDTLKPIIAGLRQWFDQNKATKSFKAKASKHFDIIMREAASIAAIASDAETKASS